MNRDTWLINMRRGARVQRFHTEWTIGDCRIAEHSYNVTVLIDAITDGKARPELLRAALYHDQAEQFIGDVPAPVKWRSKALNNELAIMEDLFNIENNIMPEVLTDEEQLLLKWADMLELLWFCYEQKLQGNISLGLIFNRGQEYLAQLVKDYPTYPYLGSCVDILCLLSQAWDDNTDLFSRSEIEHGGGMTNVVP